MSTLVLAKLRPPGLPRPSVERPRVQTALTAGLARHRILVVAGAAGAGKTAAVTQLARSATRSAWLTLDERDRASRRFVEYLAHSLAALDPALPEFAADCLAGGLPAEESAALLGQRVPAGALVVIDDVHEIEVGGAAARAMGGFAAALGDDTRLVLVGRRRPVDVLGDLPADAPVGDIGDDVLTFTADEIEALLAAQGSGADPRGILEATRGWAAGVTFEALRRPVPSPSAPAHRDMLFEYLSREVLGPLDPALREAAVASSITHVVTAARLEHILGDVDGPATVAALRGLPLNESVQGDALRWHPLFREFLRSEFGALEPERQRLLLVRAARALMQEGFSEDAVALFFAAGEAREAAEAAATAIIALLRRGDWGMALDWIGRLDPGAPAEHPTIRLAQLQALHLSGRQAEATTLVGELVASGGLARLAGSHPEIVALSAWVLRESGDWPEILGLLSASPATPEIEALRFLLSSGCGDSPSDPTALPAGAESFAVTTAVLGALWIRGRLPEMERLIGDLRERGPVTRTWTQVVWVAVLIARGETSAARGILESPDVLTTGAFRESWLGQWAALLAEEGAAGAALERIREARERAGERGEKLSAAGMAAIEGRILIRAGRFSEALVLLEELRRWCGARGLAFIREWAEAWIGGALLGLDRHAEARPVLEGVVAEMTAADRIFELPAAALFLAEARWRSGDPSGHDAAMRTAAEASTRIGTCHPLVVAWRALPEVRGPGLDTTGGGAAARVIEGGGRVRLRTFGAGAIEVDGRTLSGRLGSSLDVAAEIARAEGRGVERSRLLQRHLTDSRDPDNALRQVIHRIRSRLPPGVTLETTAGRLRFAPPGAVVSDDMLVERLVAQARDEPDDVRAKLLGSALLLTGGGVYLSESGSQAARERRAELGRIIAAARQTYEESGA